MKTPTRQRFGIVVARFNSEITDKLLENCRSALHAAGVPDFNIQVVWVPGSFEIPWAAQEMALSKRFDAVICLGAILKGRTPQNEHIAASAVHHIHSVSLSTRVPCILGIITPNTLAQAKARTRGELDRGREAAHAALALLREATRIPGR